MSGRGMAGRMGRDELGGLRHRGSGVPCLASEGLISVEREKEKDIN